MYINHFPFNSSAKFFQSSLLTLKFDPKFQLCTVHLLYNNDKGVVIPENCPQENALIFLSFTIHSLTLDQYNLTLSSRSMQRKSKMNESSCSLQKHMNSFSHLVFPSQIATEQQTYLKTYQNASSKSRINITNIRNIQLTETRIFNVCKRMKILLENGINFSELEEQMIKDTFVSNFKMESDIKNVNKLTGDPISTSYPYSVASKKETETEMVYRKDKPKNNNCEGFQSLLSLLPYFMVSCQYLSPKLKFSWWRNKIS